MRTYSKISPQFWIGKTGKKLRQSGAQLVALYMLSNPHANMLGVYHLPVAYMAHDLGLPFDDSQKGLKACVEAGFCAYDEETETVWVYEMARFQIGESLKSADNRVAGIQKEYDDLHDNPFLPLFFEKYGSRFCLTGARSFEAPSEPLRMTSEALSKAIAPPLERELKGDWPPVPPSSPPSETGRIDLTPLQENGAEQKGTFSPKTAPVLAESSPLEAPSKPLGSPFEAPSKPLRSQEQEQEQEQEQDLKIKTFASSDFSKGEKSSTPEPAENSSGGPLDPKRPTRGPAPPDDGFLPPHKRIRIDRGTLRWTGILPEDVERWKETWPAVDVEQQLREMEVWASAHQTQWKSNWLRFILHWLSKEQDKGGRARGARSETLPKTFDEIRWEKNDQARKEVLKRYGIEPDLEEAPHGTITI